MSVALANLHRTTQMGWQVRRIRTDPFAILVFHGNSADSVAVVAVALNTGLPITIGADTFRFVAIPFTMDALSSTGDTITSEPLLVVTEHLGKRACSVFVLAVAWAFRILSSTAAAHAFFSVSVKRPVDAVEFQFTFVINANSVKATLVQEFAVVVYTAAVWIVSSQLGLASAIMSTNSDMAVAIQLTAILSTPAHSIIVAGIVLRTFVAIVASNVRGGNRLAPTINASAFVALVALSGAVNR